MNAYTTYHDVTHFPLGRTDNPAKVQVVDVVMDNGEIILNCHVLAGKTLCLFSEGTLSFPIRNLINVRLTQTKPSRPRIKRDWSAIRNDGFPLD